MVVVFNMVMGAALAKDVTMQSALDRHEGAGHAAIWGMSTPRVVHRP